MKSHWILHNGKRVFISEFSNCGTDASLVSKECEAIKEALANEPPEHRPCYKHIFRQKTTRSSDFVCFFNSAFVSIPSRQTPL